MNDLDKLTQEQLITLPLPLQEAIKTVPWRESIKGIGASNGLDVDKIKTLETESLLIIYAFEPEENFKTNLLRELAIDEKTIDTLIKEIQEEVFSPILLMADSLDALGVPKTELEIKAPKQELEIALPEKETLIPEHPMEEKAVLNVEPEKQHRNINLLEEKPVVVEKSAFVPLERDKPITETPQIQTKSIIEEHLEKPVTATAVNTKYAGGIDPYREPLV